MSAITVRDMRESDAPRVTSLINWAVANTAAHFGTETQSEARTCADLNSHDRERFPWLVAETHSSDTAGGQPSDSFLGFAKSGVWSSRCGYAWTAEISVYVRPEAQGRGVGSALYERLFKRLDGAGFVTVVAVIALPNDPSVRLHESMGMRKVGHFPKMGWKHDAWRDVGYWQRVLREGSGPPDTSPPGHGTPC